MSEPEVDKKLEGALFDLLEVRAKVRLGQLVQLRRRSRATGITLLHAAFDAGHVEHVLAAEIAMEAGLAGPTALPPSPNDPFEALPRLTAPDPDPFAGDSTPGAPPFGERPTPPPLPPLNPPSAIGDRRTVPLATADTPPLNNPFSEPIARMPARPSDRATRRDPFDAPLPLPQRQPAAEPLTQPGMGIDPFGPDPFAQGPADPVAATDPFTHPVGSLLSPAPFQPLPPEPKTEDIIQLDSLDISLSALDGDDTGSQDALGHEHFDASWTGDTEPPTTQTNPSVEAVEGALAGLSLAGERYSLGRELGRGGMGQVLEATDLSLKRPVALKLLIDQDDRDLCLRFVDEARVTGQLQHPSIPPVYELGRLDDGRLFFAMQRIEGRTLREILEDLRHDEGDSKAYSQARLLGVLSRVCRSIAYAHSRGLIHRDLKPENIMLGEYGEVTVMDWGLAKPIGGPDPSWGSIERDGDDQYATQIGDVTGTPQYMPPEQADGRVDDLGAHSDIYSLGAILYELLVYEPPFDGTSASTVRKAVINDRLVPPSERAAGKVIPHAIEQLCLHCLNRDPARRPRSAAWVAEQIDAFIEGEEERSRKAAERDRLAAEGAEAAKRFSLLIDEHRQLHNKAATLRSRLDPWTTGAPRDALWAEEDRERDVRLRAARALSTALAAYHAALGMDGEHRPTRQALCSLYYTAFEAAERDGDMAQMARYEPLVRAYDDADLHRDRLKGDGSLTIHTSPQGLNATLCRVDSEARISAPHDPRPLGTTPARLTPMPMGSYVLLFEAPGLTRTPVPVYLTRNEVAQLRIRLFPDAVVGRGFAHIVGGPARIGGDSLAQLARPQRALEVDDFFLAKRPVTAAQYLDFLEDLARVEGVEAALARAPRDAPGGRSLWPYEAGRFVLPDRDARGARWHPNWAVVSICAHDAEAYCQWLSARHGESYRLPTEVEWEKAARGADGRIFPWGNAWEPSFCHMGISREGAPSRGPGSAFSTDVSPYGVEDLAGGVSEWTASTLDARQALRVVKGGHWASGPIECRAASRFTHPAEQVLPTLGFRIAKLPPR